ncbi:hypothetical protein IE077_001820 [Cardiosporidium cionae]|uniref:tRNA:m(4)X modification enzyme TRM13 n=1 Tax=Cardiosporidium cionae TaxID=476202 RepID=A0ABQ7JCB3_9APIC|nr:hypothetical protein IE077_001820 [Cardiosporidium cionae]|eukprot:KAF8821599.1 hypothetical protein IE077_001820 [Cardiosporidium cionae]
MKGSPQAESLSEASHPVKCDIQCPFDPTHTYSSTKKFHHLKRCTKIRDLAYQSILPFYIPSVRLSGEFIGAVRRGNGKSPLLPICQPCEKIYPSENREINSQHKSPVVTHISPLTVELERAVSAAFLSCCTYLGLSQTELLAVEDFHKFVPNSTASTRSCEADSVIQTASSNYSASFSITCSSGATAVGERDCTVYFSEDTRRAFQFVYLTTLLQATKSAVQKRRRCQPGLSSYSSSRTNGLQLSDDGKTLLSPANCKNASPQKYSKTMELLLGYLLSLNRWVHHVLPLSKDDIQNASIFAVCLSFGFLKLRASNQGLLIIECGGGKGSLSRWFSFALSACKRKDIYPPLIATSSFQGVDDFLDAFLNPPDEDVPLNSSDSKARILIIEREARRNKLEKKDSNLNEKQGDLALSVARLRMDLENFNLDALLQYTNLSNRNIIHSPHIPSFIHRLLSMDVHLNVDLGDPLAVWKYICRLGKGGGPSIEMIEEEFSHAYYGKKVEQILLTAKHLCGSGTDIALRSAVDSLKSYSDVAQQHTTMKAPDLFIAIVPCCHHKYVKLAVVIFEDTICYIFLPGITSFLLPKSMLRCSMENFAGLEYLNELLGFIPDVFNFLLPMTGWGTGATGQKQVFGLRLKRLLDTARVWWLRRNGFSNATLINFVSSSISPENIMIVASTCPYPTHQ